MKVGFTLPSLLLLLLLFSSAKEMKLFADSGSVRLPEHTCHKTIGPVNCKPERCDQECSKEPQGSGECRDALCVCTFFCFRPPS